MIEINHIHQIQNEQGESGSEKEKTAVSKRREISSDLEKRLKTKGS